MTEGRRYNHNKLNAEIHKRYNASHFVTCLSNKPFQCNTCCSTCTPANCVYLFATTKATAVPETLPSYYYGFVKHIMFSSYPSSSTVTSTLPFGIIVRKSTPTDRGRSTGIPVLRFSTKIPAHCPPVLSSSFNHL